MHAEINEAKSPKYSWSTNSDCIRYVKMQKWGLGVRLNGQTIFLPRTIEHLKLLHIFQHIPTNLHPA